MFFAFNRADTRAFTKSLQIYRAEFSILLKTACIKINTIRKRVCITFFLKGFNKGDLFADIIGRAWKAYSATVNAQSIKVGKKSVRHPIHHFFDACTFALRSHFYLVFSLVGVRHEVSNVRYVNDLLSLKT